MPRPLRPRAQALRPSPRSRNLRRHARVRAAGPPMNSFRVRLILAFSLITVVPLAAAIFVLTGRIESMVRTQAGERLDAALSAIQIGISGDAQRVSDKLDILSRDPALKRLYLLRGGGKT